jgi:hypothetical protein
VERLRIAGAVFIGLLWGGAAIGTFLSRDPELLQVLTVTTPVMLLPAGWLFAGPILNRRRRDDDDEQ